MLLNQIWLYNFKNHEHKSFDFIDGINAFYGKNGVGKTNVLDAIYYLCNGKSYFTNMDSKIVSTQKDEMSVKGIFNVSLGNTDEVVIHYDKDKKKTIKKNKKKYKRILEHVGNFPAVMVTPTDVALIYDDSKARRKFLDLVLCQTDRQYIQNLTVYNKYLESRHKLLKQFKGNSLQHDTTLLEAYTAKMLEPAAYIAQKRIAFIDLFVPFFEKAYHDIAGEKVNIGLAYQSNIIVDGLQGQYEKSKQIDISIGRTSKGIHKDDLIFTLNGETLKQYASQGQIKSFLIAIKIAQFDYLQHILKVKPLLLLDDIFEKIDEDRAQRLMDLVSESHFGQIFISDTHHSRLENHIFCLNSKINAIPLTHAK